MQYSVKPRLSELVPHTSPRALAMAGGIHIDTHYTALAGLCVTCFPLFDWVGRGCVSVSDWSGLLFVLFLPQSPALLVMALDTLFSGWKRMWRRSVSLPFLMIESCFSEFPFSDILTTFNPSILFSLSSHCRSLSHSYRPPAVVFVNSRKGSLLLADAVNKVWSS